MQILIIQENGRHTENRYFRECFTIQDGLKKNGVESIIWGLGHDNFSTPIDKLIEECDAILILENYPVDNWLPDLSNVKKLKLFWSIDSHCNFYAHESITLNNKVDIVLGAIESDLSKFNVNMKKHYFPNTAHQDLIYPMNDVEKTKFIGFCGTLFGDRDDYITKIEKHYNIEIERAVWWLGNDMVKKINSFHVHFNKTISNDINFRVFETLACNTLLLTNNTENMSTFFTDMHDVVMYNNENELIEKVQYLIDNPKKIIEISKNGYDNYTQNHNNTIRAKQLIDIINQYI